jgi:hydroxymethylpyrimidine pyrophosphatase-like HAD family hydrolase
MRIDLIALDLDGTLLTPDERISERSRSAIRQSLESGVRVVLVTGRGTDLPIKISRELDLNLPVICCHGALTKDFGANRTLVHLPVPLQYAKPMVEYAESHGLSLAIYSEEHFYRLEGSKLYMEDMTGPAWREAKTFADVMHEAPERIGEGDDGGVRRLAAQFSLRDVGRV